jgi:hypothetical protein
MGLRILLTVLSVVLAAVVGVATNAFSDGWQWPWGIGLAVLVVLLAGVHIGLALVDRRESGQPSGSAPAATVTGPRSVGVVSGGTVVTGDNNIVGLPTDDPR